MRRRGFLKFLASAPVVAAAPIKVAPVVAAPPVAAQVAGAATAGVSGGLLLEAMWSKKMLNTFYESVGFDRIVAEEQSGVSELHFGSGVKFGSNRGGEG